MLLIDLACVLRHHHFVIILNNNASFYDRIPLEDPYVLLIGVYLLNFDINMIGFLLAYAIVFYV